MEEKQLKVHFLLGFERSGTTLLSQLLNAHPNAISPPENLVLLQFYSKFKDKKQWTKKDIDFLVEHILWEGMKSMHLWGVDKNQLKSALYPLLPSVDYASIMRCIYGQFMLTKEKPTLKIVVDKNNPFAYHFEKLQTVFPKAKFIFLVRDYRGVFLSRKQKKVFYKSQDPYISGLMWKMTNQKIFDNLPEKLIVRYEDLVEQPEKVLSRICDYLDISYKDSMLDYEGNLDNMMQQVDDKKTREMMRFIGASLFRPIDKKLSTKWKEKLNKNEIKTLDSVCQPFAQHFDYTTEYDLTDFSPKKSLLNQLHFQLVFKPLMKHQFSAIFSTGYLKRFIHK